MRINRLAALAVIMIILTLALAGCGPDTSKPEVIVTPPAETSQLTEQPAATEALTETSEPPQVSASSAEAGFEVGKVLPDFSVPSVGGGTFTLSENLGKPIFINLFATWCPPCVGEMPEIEQLYTEMGDKVNFIIIDIGENEMTAKGFMDDNGYTLPTAYSADGAPFGSDYPIQFIPQTFVLKPDGSISAFFGGAGNYESFKAAIEEAMAQ